MGRSPMRTIVVILGCLTAGAALVAAVLCILPGAILLGVWALILLVGLWIERFRYKALSYALPGPDWQRTEERFVDPETGRLVTVYFHPSTGERRYVAA